MGVDLPLPGNDPETLPEAMPEVDCKFQLKRCVATTAYGWNNYTRGKASLCKLQEILLVRDQFSRRIFKLSIALGCHAELHVHKKSLMEAHMNY